MQPQWDKLQWLYHFLTAKEMLQKLSFLPLCIVQNVHCDWMFIRSFIRRYPLLEITDSFLHVHTVTDMINKSLEVNLFPQQACQLRHVSHAWTFHCPCVRYLQFVQAVPKPLRILYVYKKTPNLCFWSSNLKKYSSRDFPQRSTILLCILMKKPLFFNCLF